MGSALVAVTCFTGEVTHTQICDKAAGCREGGEILQLPTPLPELFAIKHASFVCT